MKKILALLATLLSTSAFAHDSTWQLCHGKANLYGAEETILVNLYEHRSESGRATELTLIFGANLLSGTLDNTEKDSGDIKLAQNKSSFAGSASVNYEKNNLKLKGKLNLSGSETDLVSSLSCKLIRD